MNMQMNLLCVAILVLKILQPRIGSGEHSFFFFSFFFLDKSAKLPDQQIKSNYSGTCVFRTRWDQPDYRGVLIFQVSLHVNGYFGTITKCLDYGGVLIFKCPDSINQVNQH